MTDERKVLRLEELPQPEEELNAEEAAQGQGGINFTKITFNTFTIKKTTDSSSPAF